MLSVRTAERSNKRRERHTVRGMSPRYALLVLAILAVAACSSGQEPAPARSSASSASAPSSTSAGPVAEEGCSAALAVGPLPAWARSGFHPPGQPIPHVMGAQDKIVAIVWARHDALHVPPLPNQANKILWVSRLDVQPGSPLMIRAALNGTGRTATRELPNGPGPSYVNLPVAGCWTLNLSWSGHRDQVELRYVPN
jgi:hypothetical protein